MSTGGNTHNVNTYDVGIVGAGVHGVSAAYHLARRGIRTVVFERSSPAGGPTGRSSGICRAYYTNAFLAGVADRSIAFLADFAEHTGGGASGYRRTGGLYLHGPDDVERVRATAGRLTELGVEVEVLSAAQMTHRFPGVDPDGVAIAVWEAQAGPADPHLTTAGLAAAAVARGATILSRTEVASLDEGPREVTVTTTDGTRYGCGRLLIAAGPWTSRLTAQLGVDLPLHAERHIVGVLGEDPGGARAPFVIIDVAAGYYSAPQRGGQTLLGALDPAPAADPDGRIEPVGDAEFAWLAEAYTSRVPAPLPGRRAGGWASLYDVSPDWQPVVGRIGERVFVDAGTSGHGFKLAPALGDHVAGLLADEPPDPALAQFDPGRFAAGARLAGGFGTARILG